MHGVEPDDISYHEVGALDSIADIVTAAFLIDELGDCHWLVAPITLGAGRVMTHTEFCLFPRQRPCIYCATLWSFTMASMANEPRQQVQPS